MNCRKVNSLLSAYIDRELTGAEMLEVNAHVGQCASCGEELESLQHTKRLLSSLSYTTPRAELEELLVVRAERVGNPTLLDRILPPEWSDSMLWRWEGIGNLGSPRLRPLAATALLSLAGLCLATASVSRPGDESLYNDVPTIHSFDVYVGPTGTLTRVPVMPEMSDQLSQPNAVLMPVGLPPAESIGGVWQTTTTPVFFAASPEDIDSGQNWEKELIMRPGEPAPNLASPRHQAPFSVVLLTPHHN